MDQSQINNMTLNKFPWLKAVGDSGPDADFGAGDEPLEELQDPALLTNKDRRVRHVCLLCG